MHPQRHDKAIYALGVDPATMGEDSAGFVILRQNLFGNRTIQVVYTDAIEKCNTVQLRDRVIYLDDLFNFEKIYIDCTGLGEGVSDMLIEHLGWKVEGIRFTQQSKQNMFDNLRLMMQEKKLTYPKTDRRLIKQLLSIKFEFSKATNNKVELTRRKKIYHDAREHDDIVCALALACLCFSRKEKPINRGFVVGHS